MGGLDTKDSRVWSLGVVWVVIGEKDITAF